MMNTKLTEMDLMQVNGGLKPDWKRIIDDAISNMKDYGQSKDVLLRMLERSRNSIDINIENDSEYSVVIEYINSHWD
ncbi:MAG: hypothetical protein IKE28_06190 [Solobacterium sp.]|nr:hypothetical protein [Solobacterium sp.]